LQYANFAENLTFLTAFLQAFLACFSPRGVHDPLLVADGFFTCIVHGFVLGLIGYPVYRVGRLREYIAPLIDATKWYHKPLLVWDDPLRVGWQRFVITAKAAGASGFFEPRINANLR
jgi:hypothetical protein